MYRHWTCSHGESGIRAEGVVKPSLHPVLMREVSWWTDLDSRDKYALGLTSTFLKCDRMEYWFEALPGQPIVPWHEFARREGVTRVERDAIEQVGAPRHWFVATVPILVVTDTPRLKDIARERFGNSALTRRPRHEARP